MVDIQSNKDRAIVTNDTKSTSVINRNGLSKEEFLNALPKQMHSRVGVEVMRKINDTLTEPDVRYNFRENLISYVSVLKAGRFKLSSYLDAVKYVSFKLLGFNNQEAFSKTFPNRVATLILEGSDDKKISAHVAMYNKNKLVNLIWEQTLIPSYVLNADRYQQAINVQTELMLTAKSEMVRSNAATAILVHLAPPEVTKIELDIGIKQDDTIEALKNVTNELAKVQQQKIANKTMSAKEIAHSTIVVEHIAQADA